MFSYDYNLLAEDLQKLNLNGRVQAYVSLAPLTWFRVGGRAGLFAQIEDEASLIGFLHALPADMPLFVLGLASNLLFRDGGFDGVVLKLGKGFAHIITDGLSVRAGCAAADAKLARLACEAGIGGLAFYRGIPGCVGGALRMNAGAHNAQTEDFLKEVRAVTRKGEVLRLSRHDLAFSYRHCGADKDLIFIEAFYEGVAGDPAALKKEMEEVAAYRELHQPTKERTGGSTFKNPEGYSAWKLIDEAGCRGLVVGGAHMSQKHCNFLINSGMSSAYDIEMLGETVRKRVFEHSGILLEWEIKRIGEFEQGREIIGFLT